MNRLGTMYSSEFKSFIDSMLILEQQCRPVAGVLATSIKTYLDSGSLRIGSNGNIKITVESVPTVVTPEESLLDL